MVVFTCNNCGESLQKPKVEKHYLTVCRRATKSLTCVDCFKDFLNEDYAAHTKCVTEEERYAAKGTFPNGVVKKGEVKQQSWMEVIQFVVKHTTPAGSGQKDIFTLLSSAVNVPRKKNKFINFVKSALNRRVTQNDMDSVWDIIEKHKSQQMVLEKVEEEVKLENGNQENISENTVDTLDAKKKSKNFDYQNEMKGTEDNKDIDVNIATEESSKKKKKKCKHVMENKNETKKCEISVENEADLEDTVNEALAKKQKKKFKNVVNEVLENVEEKVNTNFSNGSKDIKKKSNNVEESNENGNNEITLNNNEIEKKKKRKSKPSNQEDNKATKNIDLDATPETTENIGEPSKKKKKKVSKSQTDEAVGNPTSKHSENDTGITGFDTKEHSKAKKRKLEDSTAKNTNENETSKQKKTKTENSVSEPYLTVIANENQDLDTSSSFCFKEKILEIVKVKGNISLKKLQKKVLDAHQKLTGTEPSKKQIKKFNKHLKKVNGIEVSENNVRFISS